MELQEFYKTQSDSLARKVRVLKGRAHGFVMGEIASFVAAVVCVVLVTLTDNGTLRLVELVLSAVCLSVYVAVRQRDSRNDARIQRLEDLKQVYDNELRAGLGDFSCFDDGQRYVDPHHAYTYDLDVFGKDGLYQRMNRMVTTGGCDALAERLSSLDGRDTGPFAVQGDRALREAYQKQLTALAKDEKFCSEFISYGVREKIDTAAIRRALHAADEVKVGRWFGSPVVLALAIADLAGFLSCVVLAAMGRVNGLLPVWWGILQFFGVYLLCMGILKEVSKAVNRLHGQVRRFAYVVKLMERCGVVHCGGEGLGTVHTAVAPVRDGRDVFRRLTELLDGLDKRGNVMGLFVVNTFALYDFFLVRKFIKWTQNDRQEFEEWIDRVIEIDQQVTVATFLANHPDTCWAEVSEDEGVVYEARGLYHPFLGAKAVRNDFRIDNRHFYIITGANMAGKSTFLRSVGVNYILAMLGMPVFARSMRVTRFKLFSSMRTTDDLAHGISYFNAELLRLKQLMGSIKSLTPNPSAVGERSAQPVRENGETIGTDAHVSADASHSLSFEKEGVEAAAAGTDRPSLIILDEILKGTNSLDKLNGSRLFLEHVARLPVSGIVATHDLELSKMEGGRYHNYCFEIELGTDVTYSYRITPGVARNQNATFLLKQILNEK